MIDFVLVETGNGGDLVFQSGDIVLTNGNENNPYLAMFGGGDNDWWGNMLLDNPSTQFISQTENALRTNDLNSSGRLKIVDAINTDLEYLDSETVVNVKIPQPDRIDLNININGANFSLNWNPKTDNIVV